MTEILIPAVIIVAVLVAIGVIIARLYVRAPKDVAFVRTGLGGAKVVLDGGALKLPVFHDSIWVNLRTLRLEVERKREQAMITLDRMRVDIGVEFYVRVKPNVAAIALAAQTLGERTMDSEQLRDLVEAKFVDALRGVAAQMSLDDLHEKRPEFVQKVQNAVAADLEQNGLELESVSLTALDQTSAEYFNPSNAFDAEGLTRLTQITEDKKKERNEIEQTTRIAIEERNLAAAMRSLEIKREEEYVRLDTERDVANRSAATKAETAEREAEAKRVEEEARIQSGLAVRQRQIDSDREVEERRIASERDVQLAAQQKAIAVADKSKEQSRAQAEADQARAQAVEAEEAVKTVAQVAEAERDRQVTVVTARREAEREAVGITVAAEAERAAAQDRAEAVKIEAGAKAEAVKMQAEAERLRYAVEAEGQEALNIARNLLRDELLKLDLKRALIDGMPAILEAAMKPVEKIKDIRILDLGGSGLPNGGGHGGASLTAGGRDGTLVDNLVDALLRYRMQSPVIDEMLKELGLEGTRLPAILAQADALSDGKPAEAAQTAAGTKAKGPKPPAPAAHPEPQGEPPA